MKRRSLLRSAAMMAVILPAPAYTQDAAGALDRLLACETKVEDKARLSCFDEKAREVRRMRTSAAKVLESRPAKPRARLSLPVTSTIREAAWLRSGFWRVVLADGSVWQNTQPADTLPRQGREIVIRRGVLGSLRATTDGVGGALVRSAQ